ncbi:hypothetical protein QNI19_19655 [Cytophagaceae bacterium DM2B3-1]|uniref:Uncharacterized protein n=1 Tax=Xanthocytophaga flava TaxID=3048013 RepID=A0ABT7CN34_9BACT|nr:hypothetical protein [Xanthocytophaga flavus]MDJ1473085.1 hypothetical protein [Xanthocytophaga flavus]MDJ1495165.1 hypothetical protein [Xanthocytophaga flavus]
MNKREYKTTIHTIQNRYRSLKLTFEQAEQVHLFDQQTSHSREDDYFSVWEEMDFQMDTFRSILTSEQWGIYEPDWQEQIAYYVNTLIESDQNHTKEIAYYHDVLAYLNQTFVPNLRHWGINQWAWIEPSLQPKIEYLRAEAKLLWLKKKKNIYIYHYRHYRQYQPLRLQAALLQHQMIALQPVLPFDTTEEPIKLMVQFVKKNLPMHSMSQLGYSDLWEAHLAHMEQLGEQHYGKRSSRQGWHIQVTRDTEDSKVDFLMSLLLLDSQ